MPKTETDKLAGTIEKLAKELCRQSRERKNREKRNDERIEKILNDGLKTLDPGLRALAGEFGKCCSFRPGSDPDTL